MAARATGRWLLLLIALSLHAREANADDDAARESVDDDAVAALRARELRERANAAMASGRPEDALRLYREAKALTPDVALLYNEGRALQALARYPEALVVLERFDAEAGPELRARVGQLSELLDEVRAKVATVLVTCNVAGAEVRLGGKSLGRSPLAPVRVNAGAAELEVRADGFASHVENVTLAGGVETRLRVDLTPSPTRVTREPAESAAPQVQKDGAGSFARTWWFWATVGLVVAAGTAGIVLAATREREADTGSIAPGRIGAAGFRF